MISTTSPKKRNRIRRRRFPSVEEAREQKLSQVRQRIAAGYYDRPDVQRKLADILLESWGL
jgi:hypothetical protein